jgi:hypothetical protein
VAPHGSLELPSIILAGASGCAWGAAWFFPGSIAGATQSALAGVESTRMVPASFRYSSLPARSKDFSRPPPRTGLAQVHRSGECCLRLLLVWLFRPVAAVRPLFEILSSQFDVKSLP